MGSMKNEWHVTKNYVAGKILYGVYRLRDESAVDHSGNRETIDKWFGTKEEAQAEADTLNAKIVRKKGKAGGV